MEPSPPPAETAEQAEIADYLLTLAWWGRGLAAQIDALRGWTEQNSAETVPSAVP